MGWQQAASPDRNVTEVCIVRSVTPIGRRSLHDKKFMPQPQETRAPACHDVPSVVKVLAWTLNSQSLQLVNPLAAAVKPLSRTWRARTRHLLAFALHSDRPRIIRADV